MPNDELVERRARGDENADRSRPAPGAAELLPRRRDGPWVPDEHRTLQAADVDPELQRVGADHAGDLSVAQTGFDLAPMQREVTRAIPTHPA